MELIKIERNEKNEQVVSARDLHDKLGIKTKYKDWFPRMCEYGFIENTDFVAIAQKRATAQGNETTYTDHYMLIDMAKQLCMIQRSEIGTKFRLYFIECEKQLMQIDKKKLLLADLFSDDKMVVVNAHKELIELETKPLVEVIEKQKPKVEYHDSVLNPQGLVTTTNIAKDLGMSAIQLNKILHEKGIQYKKSKTWLLYDKHQNKVPEYADYKIGEYGQSLQWTEKGRQWIIDILNK